MGMNWFIGYSRLRTAAINALCGGVCGNHKWLLLSELEAIQKQFAPLTGPEDVLNLSISVFKQTQKGV